MRTFWILCFLLVVLYKVNCAQKQNNSPPKQGKTSTIPIKAENLNDSPSKRDTQTKKPVSPQKQESPSQTENHSSSKTANAQIQNKVSAKEKAPPLEKTSFKEGVPQPNQSASSLDSQDARKQENSSQKEPAASKPKAHKESTNVQKETAQTTKLNHHSMKHTSSKKERSSSSKSTPTENSQATKPIHVAIVAGCNSHFSLTVPISFALTKTATVKNKYRVTYVTSANCLGRVENVGGKLYDTGHWYYPITDPDVGIMEFATNFTMGALTNILPSLESLIIKDRPDLIISELASYYSATIAEKYGIPYAITIVASTVPPHTCKMGKATTAMLAPQIIISEDDAPLWAINFFCNFCYYVMPVVLHFPTYEASKKVNEIRRGLKLTEYDSALHAWTSYPCVLTIGEPLSPASNIEGKISVVGLLPVEKSTLDSVDIELRSFIENSEKHFVYIALGTYFAFSEKYFEEIETMLEKQIHFNVLWSHSRWTPELDQKMDQRKFFIRKMLPQKEILDSGKVKLFISHCGASSMAESLQAGVPIIGVPQGRDQFANANSIQKNKIGVMLASEPTQKELLDAIEYLHSNWDTYHENMKQIRNKMSHNSQEKLEKFVDDLVAKGYNVNFLDEELMYPLATGYVIVIVGLLIVLLPFLSITFCLCHLCCRKRVLAAKKNMKNNKQKTN